MAWNAFSYPYGISHYNSPSMPARWNNLEIPAGKGDMEGMESKPIMTNDRAAYLPQRFTISAGGYPHPSLLVTKRKRILTYDAFPDPSPERTATPSPQAWQAFWRKMDRIGAWNWAREYINREGRDCLEWSVDIQYGEKRIVSEGANCFPRDDGSHSAGSCRTPAFHEFEKAVRELCGITG